MRGKSVILVAGFFLGTTACTESKSATIDPRLTEMDRACDQFREVARRSDEVSSGSEIDLRERAAIDAMRNACGALELDLINRRLNSN